jgi:hypothetical protein
MKRTERGNDAAAPAALRQVWEWKDAVWREVENLPTRQAVHEVLVRARATAVELGFHTGRTRTEALDMAVAEEKERYGTRVTKKTN